MTKGADFRYHTSAAQSAFIGPLNNIRLFGKMAGFKFKWTIIFPETYYCVHIRL